MAEDSIRMVTISLYNLLGLARGPMASRMLLLCRTSRATMMSVRRTLSETEIEKYGRPRFALKEYHRLVGFVVW